MSEERQNEAARLMELASSGDDAAFGALVSLMQDRLFRLALAGGLRRADAAEVVQETFLRAYRQRSSWRPGGSAQAWLGRVAWNVVRDVHRKRRRLPVSGLDEEVIAAARAAGHSDHEADRERPALLAAAIAALAPRQRQAVACRFLQQMSVRETAAVMGCAEGTVKATVFAALEKLRKALAEKQ